MLFCFSPQQQKEDELFFLAAEELADDDDPNLDSVEAHDNFVNQELLAAAAAAAAVAGATGKSVVDQKEASHRRSNHRRTLSSELAAAEVSLGPQKSLAVGGGLKASTPRTFRKSQSSGAVALGAGASVQATAAAAGKFVDPSSAAAADQHSAQQHSAAGQQAHSASSHSSATSLSRALSKLGPGSAASFLRRNLSQTFRSSKGTEHLQREALRKSNESAAGLTADQSQRYIRLPSSASPAPASTPKSVPSQQQSKSSSSLAKSHTSSAIVALSESRLQQHASPLATSESTTGVGALSAAKSEAAGSHRQQHQATRQPHIRQSHSPSPTSSSCSSFSSPPPPTLVPRSANNPPPRPKTSKPVRTHSLLAPSSAAATLSASQASVSVARSASHLSASRPSPCPAPASGPLSHSSSSPSTSSSSSLSSPSSSSTSPSPSPSHLLTCTTSLTTTTCCTASMSSTVTTTTSMSPLTCATNSSPATVASCTSSSTQASGNSSSGGNSSSSSQQQQQQSSSSSGNSQQQQSSASASGSSSSHHHHQHQQFINKPPRGWLHPDHKLSDSVGVTYAVRYIGCLGVNTSMKSLDFDTRSLIAKECINRVCEAAGLKTVDKKRRTDKRIARMLSDAPNMDNAGVDVNLSITSAYLNLIVADSGENLAKHEMPNISFASGGDTDTLDFAAYVAKDSRLGRACFVLECGGGRAQDVITTIGQAFELRFKEFLKRTPRALSDRLDASGHFNGSSNSSANQTAPPRSDDREYYNDLPGKIPPDIVTPASPALSKDTKPVPHAAPRKKNGLTTDQVNLIDLSADENGQHPAPIAAATATVSGNGLKPPMPHDPQYVNCMASEDPKDPFDMQPFANAIADEVTITSKRVPPVGASPTAPTAPAAAAILSPSEVDFVPNSALDTEPWFHGPISRKQSEELVIRDGDFLVRESQVSSGQYVLTGMQSGSRKHLLLVDPEGVVRTKDKTFESVSHLINYHRNNGLPIISSESALILKHPILAKPH